ncbi:hypothetical protein ACTXT7_009784 [Hymenolepis weldensis]
MAYSRLVLFPLLAALVLLVANASAYYCYHCHHHYHDGGLCNWRQIWDDLYYERSYPYITNTINTIEIAALTVKATVATTGTRVVENPKDTIVKDPVNVNGNSVNATAMNRSTLKSLSFLAGQKTSVIV